MTQIPYDKGTILSSTNAEYLMLEEALKKHRIEMLHAVNFPKRHYLFRII